MNKDTVREGATASRLAVDVAAYKMLEALRAVMKDVNLQDAEYAPEFHQAAEALSHAEKVLINKAPTPDPVVEELSAALEKCFWYLGEQIDAKPLNVSAGDGTQALSSELARILDRVRPLRQINLKLEAGK
jgi:hypothetical protein